MKKAARATGLSISELARAAGVTVHTLKYYEREGLLPEPPRSSNNYRRYPSLAVEQVRAIRNAKELGFTLDEVRELLRIWRGGGTCGRARDLALGRAAELERTAATLRACADTLRDLAGRCSGSGDPSDCPIVATMTRAPLRALYVEDDEDLREAVKSLLERDGFQVVAVDSAEQALDTLRTRSFDLLLTDYRLPGADGAWLLDRAQQSRLLGRTAVILVTGEPDPPTAPHVVRKPFEGDRLLSVIREAVRLVDGKKS